MPSWMSRSHLFSPSSDGIFCRGSPRSNVYSPPRYIWNRQVTYKLRSRCIFEQCYSTLVGNPAMNPLAANSLLSESAIITTNEAATPRGIRHTHH